MIKLIVFSAQTSPIPIHVQPKLPLNINLNLWLINFADKFQIMILRLSHSLCDFF